MQIIGFHGTCSSAADSILANGFKTTGQRQRAGPGTYLWAGPAYLESRAKALAHTWYQQKLADGDYASEKNKAFALLRVELDVDVDEYVDLDSVVHHQGLAALSDQGRAQGKPFNDAAQLYAAYTQFVSTQRAAKGHQLKVVRVILPSPQPFHAHPAKPLVLTSGVDAYIVLAGTKSNVAPVRP